jgi:hypothetical protein
MSEGYLIVGCSMKNLTQVELLAKSIRLADPARPISIISYDAGLKDYILHIDQDIIFESRRMNSTAAYFHSLLKSPYEKTIAFLPDQLLIDFNTDVWENLRGMNSIVIPKTVKSFNGEIIPADQTARGQIEQQSFGEQSVLNAIFFNRNKACDYIFGMCSLLAHNYNQNTFIDFFAKQPNNMPSFPEKIWPSWLLSMMTQMLPAKITKFNFLECVDLSPREQCYTNNNWATKAWPEFLSCWVNDTGSIKIENFVQTGLVKYNTSSWLTDANLTNLRRRYI